MIHLQLYSSYKVDTKNKRIFKMANPPMVARTIEGLSANQPNKLRRYFS